MKKRVTREELERMIKNNEDVTRLDVSEITDMSGMFYGASTFNQDLSSWDVSNVTDMSCMFEGADMSWMSNRDKSVYEPLTVDSEMSLDDAVVCYRIITGACSLGVEKFLEYPSRVKETYKISEILKLTEGQYGSQQFQQFFGK